MPRLRAQRPGPRVWGVNRLVSENKVYIWKTSENEMVSILLAISSIKGLDSAALGLRIGPAALYFVSKAFELF